MKVIVHEVNGILAVTVPAKNSMMYEVLERNKITNYQIVDSSEIPSDREYRNAWKYDNGINVDIDKAKEIHKDKLRIKRKPLLQRLDVDYMMALEKGDTILCKQIAEEKQKLRDITKSPEITEARSVEDLKKFQPI
jgi:hypothetical protein